MDNNNFLNKTMKVIIPLLFLSNLFIPSDAHISPHNFIETDKIDNLYPQNQQDPLFLTQTDYNTHTYTPSYSSTYMEKYEQLSYDLSKYIGDLDTLNRDADIYDYTSSYNDMDIPEHDNFISLSKTDRENLKNDLFSILNNDIMFIPLNILKTLPYDENTQSQIHNDIRETKEILQERYIQATNLFTQLSDDFLDNLDLLSHMTDIPEEKEHYVKLKIDAIETFKNLKIDIKTNAEAYIQFIEEIKNIIQIGVVPKEISENLPYYQITQDNFCEIKEDVYVPIYQELTSLFPYGEDENKFQKMEEDFFLKKFENNTEICSIFDEYLQNNTDLHTTLDNVENIVFKVEKTTDEELKIYAGCMREDGENVLSINVNETFGNTQKIQDGMNNITDEIKNIFDDINHIIQNEGFQQCSGLFLFLAVFIGINTIEIKRKDSVLTGVRRITNRRRERPFYQNTGYYANHRRNKMGSSVFLFLMAISTIISFVENYTVTFKSFNFSLITKVLGNAKDNIEFIIKKVRENILFQQKVNNYFLDVKDEEAKSVAINTISIFQNINDIKEIEQDNQITPNLLVLNEQLSKDVDKDTLAKTEKIKKILDEIQVEHIRSIIEFLKKEGLEADCGDCNQSDIEEFFNRFLSWDISDISPLSYRNTIHSIITLYEYYLKHFPEIRSFGSEIDRKINSIKNKFNQVNDSYDYGEENYYQDGDEESYHEEHDEKNVHMDETQILLDQNSIVKPRSLAMTQKFKEIMDDIEAKSRKGINRIATPYPHQHKNIFLINSPRKKSKSKKKSPKKKSKSKKKTPRKKSPKKKSKSKKKTPRKKSKSKKKTPRKKSKSKKKTSRKKSSVKSKKSSRKYGKSS